MEAFSLLLKRGVRPKSAHNGATLLMEAVDKNRADFVSFLLGHSHNGIAVDVTHKDDQGNNVLFYAAAAGNLGVIKDLLKAGCPVENDAFGRSILMQAVLHGHASVVQFLFNNSKALGIDVHQRDADGRNLLFYW
jgi:ankyrin repeat protein